MLTQVGEFEVNEAPVPSVIADGELEQNQIGSSVARALDDREAPKTCGLIPTPLITFFSNFRL